MKKVLVLIIMLFVFFSISQAQVQTAEVIRDTVNISVNKKNRKVDFILYKIVFLKIIDEIVATSFIESVQDALSFPSDWYLFTEGGIILAHSHDSSLVVFRSNGMNNTQDFINLGRQGLKSLGKYLINKYVQKGETVYAPFILTRAEGYKIKRCRTYLNGSYGDYIYLRYK